MIKLVLTDMDDTLIPFGRPCASDRAIEAIHAAQAAGVHVGPVTGRPPCSMQWMFPGHPECHATGAFANGQVIDIDGERVHVVGISREIFARVEELADELGDVYLVVYDLDDLNDASFVTTRPERLRACPPPSHGVDPANVMLELDRDYVKANLQCARTVTHERADELRREFAARISELDFVFPGPNATLFDMAPHGWTKGTAALYLGELLGIAPDEIAVFGDSENDLAMIQAIPNSVAVANAAPEVLACARWHIGHCADGAVDDALFDIAAAVATGDMPRFMRSQT